VGGYAVRTCDDSGGKAEVALPKRSLYGDWDGRMKSRYWWYFGSLQALGTAIGMSAGHVDRVLTGMSLVLLLPGIFASLPFFTEGRIGNFWPKWTFFAIAVAANFVVFILVRLIVEKRRN
jgi:hypothetical protein